MCLRALLAVAGGRRAGQALGSAARLQGRAAPRSQRRAPRLHHVAEAVTKPWRGRAEALYQGDVRLRGAVPAGRVWGTGVWGARRS